MNLAVYGVTKACKWLNWDGIRGARRTVERVMGELGLRGAVRGRALKRTTWREDERAERPDLVQRDFEAGRPNQLWVSHLIYVVTWPGCVYRAFVIDTFARRIVRRLVASSLRSELALAALEQAILERSEPRDCDLVCHGDRGW